MVFNDGHVFRGGKYEVVINSGTGDSGIQDVAGNALDGNFYGSFPSGDGLAGGNFVAAIPTFHRVVLPFVPTADGYVPPPRGSIRRLVLLTPGKPTRPRSRTRTRPSSRDPITLKTAARNTKLKAVDAALKVLAAERKANTAPRIGP